MPRTDSFIMRVVIVDHVSFASRSPLANTFYLVWCTCVDGVGMRNGGEHEVCGLAKCEHQVFFDRTDGEIELPRIVDA